ncbi:MAG: PAS domain-containing protein [Terriglobales bacterium]
MTPQANSALQSAALLFVAAVAAFAVGLFLIRRLGKTLTSKPDRLDFMPMTDGGLPPDAYNALIQQLKQPKYSFDPQQLSSTVETSAVETHAVEMKTSHSLDSPSQPGIPSGVLFLNAAGIVRRANKSAGTLLGFSSLLGMNVSDLFRDATVHLPNQVSAPLSIAPALGAALLGTSPMQSLQCDYVTPDGERRLLTVSTSPVIAADGIVMGATLILHDLIQHAKSNSQPAQQPAHEDQPALREPHTNTALVPPGAVAEISVAATLLDDASLNETKPNDAWLNDAQPDDAQLDDAKPDETFGDLMEAGKGAASGS